jgi:hypothetical protein
MGKPKLYYDPSGWDEKVWVVCSVNDPDNFWDGRCGAAGEAMQQANEINLQFRRSGETTQYVTVREVGPNDSYSARQARIGKRTADYWAGPGAARAFPWLRKNNEPTKK